MERKVERDTAGRAWRDRGRPVGVVHRFLVRALRLSSARLSCRRRGCRRRDLGKFAALAAGRLTAVGYSALCARVQVFPAVDCRWRRCCVARSRSPDALAARSYDLYHGAAAWAGEECFPDAHEPASGIFAGLAGRRWQDHRSLSGCWPAGGGPNGGRGDASSPRLGDQIQR